MAELPSLCLQMLMSVSKVLSYVIQTLSAQTPSDSIPAHVDLGTLEMATRVLVGHMTTCEIALLDHVTPFVGHMTACCTIG